MTLEEIELGLENGTVVAEIIKPGKTAEEVYNELLEAGENVVIHNGVYCKVVYNTFEAINSIQPEVEYHKVEEVEA